jgi:DNA-binding CsgD family transcriptional regulator/tetratricopeptide (TPR) repeat protein
MGLGVSDLAEILPELLSKLDGLEKSPVLDPEQARFRLFFSIATFLKNASQNKPLVLVLDDLHWADRSSLLLLEFFVLAIGASPILVVGTYRDIEVTGRHPLVETLGALVREDRITRVFLGGLDRQEVGELLEARTGIAIGSDAVDALHHRTDGNPLFVGEIVGSVTPEEMAQGLTWIDRIPEVVRDAIPSRINRLSHQCATLLEAASIVGRDFDFELLRMLCPGVDNDEFADALDEALAIRMIEALPERPGRFRFSHALIQQAVYEEITPTRRMLAHTATGEALERFHEANPSEQAARMAHHFAEAGLAAGAEKAARYSLIAGEKALESYAWEEALENFQLGLRTKGVEVSRLLSAPDQVSADLLFGLGRAQVARARSPNLNDAMDSFIPAFNWYVSSQEAERAVAIAVYPMPLIAGYVTGAGKLIERALDMVPADSLQAGRLQASYGRVKGLEEVDYEAASRAFEIALDIGRQIGDIDLELQTLSFACDVDGYHVKLTEALEKGRRAVELAGRIDNPRAELMARMWCFFSLLTDGNLTGASAHASAMLPLWERLRHPEYGSRAFYAAGAASLLAGSFDSARELSDQGLAVAPRDPRLLKLRILLEYDQGNIDEGRAYLDRFVDIAKHSVPGPNVERAFVAMVIAIINRIADTAHFDVTADEFSRTILDSPISTPGVTSFVRIGKSLLSALRGDAAAAAEHYKTLFESQHIKYGIDSGFPTGRILGLLADTAGQPELAVTHFEDGLTFCRLGGFKPALAWTCLEYAEMLVNSSVGSGRIQDETRTKSMSLQNEALAISSELQMLPLIERVTALQKRTGLIFGPGPIYPGGLTKRELEVLRLVASGFSNREIGSKLVLSTRTVERHITNIYRKINARGRADATGYALGHGLLD